MTWVQYLAISLLLAVAVLGFLSGTSRREARELFGVGVGLTALFALIHFGVRLLFGPGLHTLADVMLMKHLRPGMLWYIVAYGAIAFSIGAVLRTPDE